jgi:hypothetical protein
VGSSKKNEKSEKNEQAQAASRYIHMAFNQEELLGEAATTEYYNWLSLKKLISIETERKDFTRRSHHIEGPKVVYRDRISATGTREQTYELQGVEVGQIEDLTRIMNQN